MAAQDKDRAISDLRQWMEVVENDVDYGRMGAALRRIRNWDPAGGEPMPYAREVGGWRERYGPNSDAIVAEPDLSGADEPAILVPVPALDTPQPTAPESPPSDPDDHLQQLFDNAQAMLDGGALYEAMKGFESVATQATGRLRQPAEEGKQAARAALDDEKRLHLIAAARATDDRAAIAAWQKVVALDPEDAQALAILKPMYSRESVVRIRAEIDRVRRSAEQAVGKRDLPRLNSLVGEADSLRRGNTAIELHVPLYDLLQEVTEKRDELRANLGSPSTLIAIGNNREAYSRARKLLEDRVPVVVDTAGILGGEPGAEVETIRFVGKAREIYLAGLGRFAVDRLRVAEGEQKSDPEAALETLNEVVAALTDEVLTNDDRGHLEYILTAVERNRTQLVYRRQVYLQARELVISANQPGISADERYTKLRAAREVYPDYPGIEEQIRMALAAVAATVAAMLEGELALARLAMAQGEHEKALGILQSARTAAVMKLPDPVPGSPLAERLLELRALEFEIIDKASKDRDSG